jgi:hypothetical protein
VQLPEGDTGWKDALQTFAASLRQLAHTHPHAYGLLCGRGILPEPGLRAIDVALTTLERAGLNRDQAAEMIRTLVSYATGLEQIVRLTQALPRDTPVHLVEVARLMADCDMEYQFNLGLDLILTGLESRLDQPGHAMSVDHYAGER